jgi:predicted phosphate transport protein (TIGR00153 family)
MPKSAILSMFARSPIRPLERHMDKANQCAEKLADFFQCVFQNDWLGAEKVQKRIVTLEKEADALKLDLRMHLPNGLFLPVSRSDILELLTKQDQIANCAEDIAGLTLGRQMAIPGNLQDLFSRYLARCIDASKQATRAINELDELLETGFKGKEVEMVEGMVEKLNIIERDTDDLQVELRQALFKIEKELDAIDAMFLYKVVDAIGSIADIAQQTGGRLIVLLAH